VASYSQMGEYELALQEQDEFLRALANSDSEEGTNSLAVGSIYFNQRNYEDALRQYKDFLAAHPDDPEAAVALLNSGDCYYRLQYYEQAIAAWNDVLARFPESKQVPEAMYRIADTQFGLGQFESARSTYRRLAASNPDGQHAADAAFGLANCAYNLNEDQAAIEAFTAFVESYPRDARVEDAELGIQSAYYRSGKDMTEYLAHNPDSALAADVFWNKGQEAFASGDFASAAAAFDKVTLDYPESESGPGALYYLAESYYRMEQLEPALAGFKNFITTHADHDYSELARFRAGTVLFRLERFEQAAREYEIMRDLDPQGEYAALGLFNAAVCYQQIEDWTAAIANYESFLQQYPTHEKAQGLWTEIAAIYQDEIGAWDSAIEAWERAGELGQGSMAEIRYRQGECHRKAGRLDPAIESFRSAGGGSGDDPFTIAGLAEMGELLEDRGDWAGAMGAYQSILAKATKPEWTAMAQGRVDAIREMQAAGR
jgi:tetratricopeptide (TPR) repeat protein